MLQLKDIIQNKNISVFDTETMQYGRREQVYSAAMYSGGKHEEVFLKMPNKFLEQANYRSRKFLKRSGYFDVVENAKKTPAKKLAEYSSITQRSDAISSLFKKNFKKGDILVGHNLAFDLPHVTRSLSGDNAKSFLSMFNAKNKRAAKILGRPQTVSNLIQSTQGGKAYTEYMRGIKSALDTGHSAVADTLTLSQILLAGATERKDINFDFSKDVFSGLKLGFIKDYFGYGGVGHTGEGDTGATKQYFDWLTEKALPQIFDKGVAPDKEVLDYLNYIKNIQDSGWRDISKRSKVAGLAFQYMDKGSIAYESSSKYKYLSGDVTSDQVFNMLGGKEYSGFSSENFAKEWQSNIDEIAKVKASNPRTWKTRMEILHNNRFYADESKYLEEFKTVIGSQNASKTTGNILFRTGAEQASRRNKFLIGAGAAVGAFAVFKMATISGKDDDYNTIEGMRHGGVAEQKRHELTDFGSGYIGPILKEFARSLKEYKGIAMAGSIPGLLYGYHKGKEEGKISAGQFAKAVALDMADDVLIFGAPTIIKKFPKLEKNFTTLTDTLSRPIFKKAGVGFFGFTVGKLAGEFAGKISGKDDAYNTIEGLRHGGVAEQMRRTHTDFGSGYRGPVAPIHHPEINPDYNEAKDIPRYELFRASKIGASEEEIYKWATQEDKQTSPYVEASASAGTALHQLMQAQQLQSGAITETEQLTYSNGITGHIDMNGPNGIGDIKTVNQGIFNTIVKSGQPKPMHKSQVMFYLGSEGQEQGYVQYVNRDNPSQKKTFVFQFNPYQYEQLLRKSDRVRSRIEAEIEAGKLIKSNLPKTASLQRLQKDFEESPSNAEKISTISQDNRIFKEEMAYLNRIKRGMPASGKARERIERSKRERAMQSTQGIGLQLFNTRNNHHIM